MADTVNGAVARLSWSIEPCYSCCSFHSSGLGTKDPGFDADGRRPQQWRDKLEDMIVGDWEWREGEVSGVPRGQPLTSGKGRYGMIYNFGNSRKVGRSLNRFEDRGVSLDAGVTVKDQFIRWGNEIPQTKFVAHTPGTSFDQRMGC